MCCVLGRLSCGFERTFSLSRRKEGGVLLAELTKVQRYDRGVAALADVVVAVSVHEKGTVCRDDRREGFGSERVIVAWVGVVSRERAEEIFIAL